MTSRKGSKKESKSRTRNPRGTSNRMRFILFGIAGGLMVAVVVILLVKKRHFFGNEFGVSGPGMGSGNLAAQTSAGKSDFRSLVGEWLRPDGGYIIRIRGVGSDGQVDAGYYNPRPINVSRAHVSKVGDDSKVFIELRDTGYPGSTYTLVYNAEKDVLVGVYYQAAQRQNYNVVFFRMK